MVAYFVFFFSSPLYSKDSGFFLGIRIRYLKIRVAIHKRAPPEKYAYDRGKKKYVRNRMGKKYNNGKKIPLHYTLVFGINT